AFGKRQLIGAREHKRMRYVVCCEAPFTRLRVDGILNADEASSALAAVRTIIVELRPRVERAELKTAREPLVEFDLDRVVAALADRDVAVFNRLVLWIRPQRLGDDSREARIRTADARGLRLRRVDVGLQQCRSEAKDLRIVHVVSGA